MISRRGMRGFAPVAAWVPMRADLKLLEESGSEYSKGYSFCTVGSWRIVKFESGLEPKVWVLSGRGEEKARCGVMIGSEGWRSVG
jgi:hypothetical protein